MLVPGDLGAALAECFWHPHLSRSYEDKPLRVREEVFRNGIGMLAPANIRYMIHPGYRRFVALAGIDDNMLDKNLGRFLASRPSVIFRVFIDGELAGESPIIRMSHEPWRFNIALPPNARQLDLSVSPSTKKEGEYDFANWLNADFVTERHTPHE
jgi:hypothetical protein